ncbi:MAG: histidine phosphatase family protein [Parvibaculum sp.]|uniref:histidine phosphatase family protein n=1 Tax=Parvibaculum sp. TaxID=2024848 RepID=UPI0025E8DE2C|nr:histidine phosphatase family protein [Parvibaculum sp.]MCE9651202.1 histidine phosphatase family protein [Parvibaculum sp.]
MPCRLILVRHASALPSKDQPEADWPLSDEGRRQAEMLAAELVSHGIDALWSSPYPRALATIEPFARAHGLSIGIDHDLRERLFSSVWIDDFETPLRQSFEDEHFALPGGESGFQCRSRFMAALSRIAAQHKDQTVAIASHGNAIALTLSALDASVGFDFWKSIRKPDLFLLEWDGGFSWPERGRLR